MSKLVETQSHARMYPLFICIVFLHLIVKKFVAFCELMQLKALHHFVNWLLEMAMKDTVNVGTWCSLQPIFLFIPTLSLSLSLVYRPLPPIKEAISISS